MSKEPDERKVFGVMALIAFALASAFAVLIIRWFDVFRTDHIGGTDLAVLGLACLRLIHLITYDKLLEPVREPLEGKRGLKGLLHDFVSCIWCTGMWSALITTTLYFLGAWGRLAVIVLAVAGLGALLQVVSRAVAGCTIEPQR